MPLRGAYLQGWWAVFDWWFVFYVWLGVVFGLVNSRAGILGSVPEKYWFFGFLEVSEGP